MRQIFKKYYYDILRQRMYENGSDSELGQSYLTYKDGRRCNGKFFEKF